MRQCATPTGISNVSGIPGCLGPLLIKQFAHNWHLPLPVHGDVPTCLAYTKWYPCRNPGPTFIYQTRSAWSVDQGSTKKCSAVHNFAPTGEGFYLILNPWIKLIWFDKSGAWCAGLDMLIKGHLISGGIFNWQDDIGRISILCQIILKIHF